MPRLRFCLFAALALGYATVGFLAGQFLLQSVLDIDLIDYLPMPGLAIQSIGFVIAFILVVGGTAGAVQLLSLDKM